MPKRLRREDYEEELNIWSAFTDLMSNAFMILMLFLLITILKSVFVQSISESSGNQTGEIYEKLAILQKELQQKNSEIKNLKKQVKRQVKDQKSPPVIVIKDSPERKFKSASAELSPGLRSYIETKLVNQIEDNAKKYPGYVIEIIGHTDGQINFGSSSNLDQILEQVAKGRKPVSSLQPGSNADLGLMRALAVVKVLQDMQQNKGNLKGLKFRAYSAAQLFLPQGDYAPINRNSDDTRRRIEIRFTPLGNQQ